MRRGMGLAVPAFCIVGWIVFALCSGAAIRWKVVTAALVVLSFTGQLFFPEAWMGFVILQGILGICFYVYSFGV